eukprot:4487322-Alexandrium_andersonii.AAC.1
MRTPQNGPPMRTGSTRHASMNSLGEAKAAGSTSRPTCWTHCTKQHRIFARMAGRPGTSGKSHPRPRAPQVRRRRPSLLKKWRTPPRGAGPRR